MFYHLPRARVGEPFNLSILECKSAKMDIISRSEMTFNLSILECKYFGL